MSQSKICPKCQVVAPLDARICRNCAHAFRTQFAPPVEQTQMYAPPTDAGSRPLPPTHFQHHMATRKTTSPVFVILAVIGGLAVAFVGLCLIFGVVSSRQSSSVPTTPTDVILDQSATSSFYLGESENEMLTMYGKPAPEPGITDDGGHLWVYDLKQGGCLAARFNWNGQGYALRDALTINAPVKWKIGND